MKRLVLFLTLLVACLSFACADEAARYVEYVDDLGTCRQYTQTHSHWNHSTIFVFDDFAHDRMYVSMNVTAKRMGAVKVRLRPHTHTYTHIHRRKKREVILSTFIIFSLV